MTLEKTLIRTGKKFHHVATGLSWPQEKQFALAIISQSPALSRATNESLEQAVLQAGSMGLSLNPSLGYCYLIPRRARRRKQGENMTEYANVPTLAYASPSYKGISNICERSGKVAFIRAEVIFKADHFVYMGPVEKPTHVPTLKSSERQENLATGVYAIAKLASGDYLSEYLDRDIVYRIRRMSERPDSIMWDPEKLWTEGWKKAVIRRLTKTLPKSPMIDMAISQLNTYEGISDDKEPALCVSERDVTKLHAMLTDYGVDNPDRWLAKLAKRFGVNQITDLPADQLEKAESVLVDALKNAAADA